MNRRVSVFVAILSICSIAASSLWAVAADLPVVRQPNDPAYSAADRTALSTAWTAIERLLAGGTPIPAAQLVQGGWSERDFVLFAGGTLQSAGYPIFVAAGSISPNVPHTWLLVGVALPSGTLGYVPVEAAPSVLGTDRLLGRVPWQGGGVGGTYDPRYLAFTAAPALPANAPPAVTLMQAGGYVVVDETTTFMIVGRDPDGSILACVWTLSDGTVVTDPRVVYWHTFRSVGKADVQVVVIDNRGGRTSLSMSVDVLAEAPDCGCGK